MNMRWLLHWGDEIYWLPLISLLVAAIAVFGTRMLTIWLYLRRVVLPMSEIESNDEAVRVIKERYSAPGAIVPASVSSLYFLTGIALIIVTLWGTITVAWWVLPLGCVAWFVIHAPFRNVMESWSSFQRTMWVSEDAAAIIKGGLTPEQERKLRKRIRLP